MRHSVLVGLRLLWRKGCFEAAAGRHWREWELKLRSFSLVDHDGGLNQETT